MNPVQKIPVARALYRYWQQLTRPSPLQEFANYDAYWNARLHEGKHADMLDRYRIVSRLVPDGASVLDVGCGDGAFLKFMHDSRPKCRLLGADISRTAISALENAGLAGQRIDPAQPLEHQLDGHWEYVVLMEVIEHVVDAEGLVRQVMSLHPTRIIITIPNVGFLIHRLRLMFVGRFPVTNIIYHMKEHVRFWTVKDFYQWADALGLRVCSHYGQVDRKDKLVQWLGREIPSLFAGQMVYELVPLSGEQ